MCDFCFRNLTEKQTLLHQAQVCGLVSVVSRHKTKVREYVHKLKNIYIYFLKMVQMNHCDIVLFTTIDLCDGV